MSRKKYYTEAFEPPLPEEVQRAVDAIGGKAEASRLLRKNWCTVDRWCTGKIKIDYANWKLISDGIK
jgi:hypothetical protein